jgi:hypothetical protein
MTEDYNNPLYGRRILHIMSPVRWRGNKFQHHGDSNYKVMVKTIKFLPQCHHTVLVPRNNNIPDLGKNVNLIPFDYSQSVLSNRAYFNGKELANRIVDWRGQDFDFIFNHQPELLYNVVNSLLSSRYGLTLECFNFFHWVDCPKSRVTDGYPEGFFRQLEAISFAHKSYFHCPVSLDYMKSNWDKKEYTVSGLNEKVMNEKINYFPLGVGDFPNSEPVAVPPGKKILLFNHRWNNTTGIQKLVEYTKDLDRDEWLVWVTDESAKKPNSGKPAPKWMYVKNLPSGGQYRSLIEKSFATLCFVDNYMTWNLSVQDAIKLKKPSLAFKHPTYEYVLGENYPLYFSSKEEFHALLNKIPENKSIDWELPPHDQNFKDNLVNDLIDALENSKKKKTTKTKYGVEWLYHILQGNGYKKNLLHNSHPDLHKSNAWEGIRQWCLDRGVKDTPDEIYTKLWIPEENKEAVQKIIDEAGSVDYKGDPLGESKQDPKWSKNYSDNKFF